GGGGGGQVGGRGGGGLAVLCHRLDKGGWVRGNRLWGTGDHQIEVTGDEIVGGGAAPAIGDVHEPHTRLLPQQFHGEVANAASSDRCIAHRPGSGLCGCDDIDQRLERFLRVCGQHIGGGADKLHRVEVLLGVERQLGHD